MSRLIDPVARTVVHVEGDLEVAFRARGWVDADAPTPVIEATPVKPKRAPRRARTN